MRRQLREKVNFEFISAKSLMDDLISSSFTGYIKVILWNEERYIPFYEGTVQEIISVRDDTVETLPYSEKHLPITGTGEIYETDVVSIMNMLNGNCSIEKCSALCLAGYGEVLQDTQPAGRIDFNKFISVSEETKYNGYILIHSYKGPISGIFFFNGKPIGVCICKRDEPFHDALNLIRNDIKKNLATIFILPPELTLLLYNMKSMNANRKGVIKNKLELEALMQSIKDRRISGVLYIKKGSRRRYYGFFYKGLDIRFIYQDITDIIDIDISESDVIGAFVLYTMQIDPNPRAISLDSLTADKPEYVVPVRDIENIKDAFIEEIGPIGKVVWKKILQELGWEEDAVPVDKLNELVDRLSEEIPYDVHKNAFLKRVRRS